VHLFLFLDTNYILRYQVYGILVLSVRGGFMGSEISGEESEAIRLALVEMRLEHRDLDEIIHRLSLETRIEELKIKRLKKRKLYLKDQITRLENKLIPDILA